ncbi:MAG: hypothetical protein SAJ37_15180 [Oscillatoria sp. PMC 1068.18]|nr:hypothetical protein [Oscillatoria sp. PMC 1076.18]MEC4990074.1 hypothetical protein [Oscillatoria sp. PMC 1068.18]
MSKKTKWNKIALRTAIVILGFLSLLTIFDSQATSNNQVSNEIPRKDNQKKKSTAERLLDLLRRRPRKPGTQGGFCLVFPNFSSYTTWSSQPLFIWQGNVTKIQLTSDNLEWTHEVAQPDEKSVLYDGSPLEPGEEYSYIVTYETINEGEKIINTEEIEILILPNSEERSRIEAELAKLENPTSSLSLEERKELALQRAEIFAREEDLWWDVVREIYLVDNSSSDWNRDIQEDLSQLCQ